MVKEMGTDLGKHNIGPVMLDLALQSENLVFGRFPFHPLDAFKIAHGKRRQKGEQKARAQAEPQAGMGIPSFERGNADVPFGVVHGNGLGNCIAAARRAALGG
ncbi:hypothetical protein SDC9_202748 [bioreactor metagenome]|uniref:Uncharacterized protein n=1 Tax=bioreactor metagenome TaxID=1076179 RepID=A0A645IXA2_9ZZZZ